MFEKAVLGLSLLLSGVIASGTDGKVKVGRAFRKDLHSLGLSDLMSFNRAGLGGGCERCGHSGRQGKGEHPFV